MPGTMFRRRPAVPETGLAGVPDVYVPENTGYHRELWAWATLGLAALAVAGVFAVLLVLSRVPHAQDWLPWGGQDFFRRALVTHVMFSFVVWYLAILGALSVLAVAWLRDGTPPFATLGRLGLGSATLGVVLMFLPALLDIGEPSLNNYVPVVIHPLYFLGVGLLFGGVALAVLRFWLCLPGRGFLLNPLGFAIAVTGVMYLIALGCFVTAWVQMPPETNTAAYIEYVFWGGGHVLQFVNTAILLIAWQVVCEIALGRPALPAYAFRSALMTLLLFVLAAPLFYAQFPVTGLASKDAFTDLLKYGLIAPPTLAGLGVILELARHGRGLASHTGLAAGRPWWRDPHGVGLALAVFIFGAGGAIGYFLGPSDTRIPSHYHAVIGGVNIAIMSLFLLLFLPILRRAAVGWRWQMAMLALYGIGQSVWSLGMFLAGTMGVPRKTGGAAQGLDSLGKVISMGITSMGGMVAVIGGVLFIWIVLGRMLRREVPDA